MIEFVTLYLGLVVGLQPLQVSVGPAISSVEIVLDGETVAKLMGEPWQISFDFGPRLIPHHLEAVARDATGLEVTRAEQWLNLPRQRAEAKLALESDDAGKRWARVIWEAIDFEQPRKVEAFLDGKRLEVERFDLIELPKLDPQIIHFLAAELEFSDSVSARAEIVFGGTYGDEVSSELTSIVLQTDRTRPPRAEQLRGRLLHRGEPVHVVAVDRPPIEIIVVREHSTGMFDSIQRLITTSSAQRISSRANLTKILRPADRVRFALTAAHAPGTGTDRYEQIPVTGDLTPFWDANLWQILSRIGPAGSRQPLAEERIADAVSVAGLVGADSNRRRVVLLLSTFGTQDVSRLAPATVRDYLNSLTVPLTVWQLVPPGGRKASSPTGWGDAVDVTDWGGMGRGFRELWETLDSQVVVWVEGRYLQREITVTPGADGLRLAQRDSPELQAELETVAMIPVVAPVVSQGQTASTFRQDNRIALASSDRIERAVALLGSPQSFIPLGPAILITDGEAPRLHEELERMIRGVPGIFSQHYQIPVDLSSGATVVLFDKEASYRAYESAIGLSGGELAGHASSDLLALYAGDRSKQGIIETFIHELVHLLTVRALGSDLPPWLNEGLAESMTFADRTGGDSMTLGPLDPRHLRMNARRMITGPLAILGSLTEASERNQLPPLRELMQMDREAFAGAENRRELYALSAFWVHYLGTVDTANVPGFRNYLAALSSGEVKPSDALAVEAFLETEPDQLQSSFESWLRWVAAEISDS
jgi:hypothetical protein